MFMKKIAIAAAMTLCAAGAYASNFRAADQVYLPVAGHLAGSSGVFISDVYVSNLSTDPVDVSVVFQTSGANPANPKGTEYQNAITLRGLERKEYKDFFRTVLGQQAAFGQLIFNGCKSGTDCSVTDANGYSPNFRPISVESRIYQVANETQANLPTTGQLFSGIPWYNFVSQLQSNVGLDKVFITGITHTGNAGTPGTFRTNIGLVNASEYSTTTLDVKLYQGTMTAADMKGEALVNLGPLGNVQQGFAALFPGVPFGANYFVTVEQKNSTPTGNAPASCDTGCPAFLAYGSVLDNLSGDATTLESQYLKELDPDALVIIYPPNAGKTTLRRSVHH